ncbi:MAG: hypothetical protein ACWA5U_01700 [bacterium]
MKKNIILLFLGSIISSPPLYADPSENTAPVLKCYARLGEGDQLTGMTLKYSVPEKKVTVYFVKQNIPENLNHGQCTLKNLMWDNGNSGHFCHFNVSDVVYTKNINSMNLISDQAPYLIKILKYGGEFSLKVHRDDNVCKGGLVVDQVLPEEERVAN